MERASNSDCYGVELGSAKGDAVMAAVEALDGRMLALALDCPPPPPPKKKHPKLTSTNPSSQT